MEKLLAISLELPGIWDAVEAASVLARAIRAADRTLDSATLVQLPWLDGSRGTLDFLVTHSLGSFLEVEATSATGEEIVAPLGFAGEDGKLAVIELARLASVATAGERGCTAGIGELIQDALDEGAFSIVLCHEEPIAFDAGFGAAAALGIQFLDANGAALDFTKPGSRLSEVHRIDTTARSFALLSSRLYVARSQKTAASKCSPELVTELSRLANIVMRDTGVPVTPGNWSASAIEFGLTALLGAEVRDGHELVLEASRIPEAIARGEFAKTVVLAPSDAELRSEPFAALLDLVRSHIPHRAILLNGTSPSVEGAEPVYSLPQVPIFQAPLRANASPEEHRRDITMRLEKVMPEVLAAMHPASTPSRHARHA